MSPAMKTAQRYVDVTLRREYNRRRGWQNGLSGRMEVTERTANILRVQRTRCSPLLLLIIRANTLLLLLVSLPSSAARAQATTEAAAASGAASVSAGTSKSTTNSATNRIRPAPSAHVAAPSGQPADETNRKTLEENAGPDAGKLMMHSVPTGAQIFINGLYVGHAPLLLLLAPAKYKLEMRGQRQDVGQRIISLEAHETHEIVVTLAPKYPGKVSTQ